MSRTSTLELWQTEWCPASQRVRQRMTELGLSYMARQVPVAREERAELRAATGSEGIPVLVDAGVPVAGEEAILAHLDTHYVEPPQAAQQRAKAVMAKHKQLEAECRKLAAATH